MKRTEDHIDDKAREFAYTLIKWPDGSEQVAISPDSVTSYKAGYEQAEKDIIALIESRISEILGDAQPKPALRAELQELIKRIKEEEK